MTADVGIGDDATESDPDPALHRFVSGGLCDQGVDVDPMEGVGETRYSLVASFRGPCRRRGADGPSNTGGPSTHMFDTRP